MRYQLYLCNAYFLWPDNDINGSDAVRVLCNLAGQRYQWQPCSACYVYFGRKQISIIAMQGVFFMAGQRYQWQRCSACFVYFGRTAISIVAMQYVFCVFRCNACFLWQDNDINGSDAVRVLCILAGQ